MMKRLALAALLLTLTPSISWAACSGTPAGNRFCASPSTGSGPINPRAIVNSDLPSGIDAAKIGGGSVSTTEYDRLNGITAFGQSVIGLADEAALEATLDTLANLTSIQGVPVTFTDQGLDNLYGWDDSVGEFSSLSLAEILTEAAPAAGDFVLIYGAEGDIRKVDWDDLPAGGGGGGDVSKVGTPVDNQIGVWTGDGTIEGDAALTFNTTNDDLVVAASGNLLFGAVSILDDAAGTMTLSNIDAIDATTETTLEAAIDTFQAADADLTTYAGITPSANVQSILGAADYAAIAALQESANEAAIDTLANLTSVQGRTVTLADAATNAFFGWDDAASAYENLTAAEAEAIMEPLLDTLANVTSIQGQTVTLSAPFTLGADPNADRLLFWDDSAGATAYLTPAAPLTITTTTIDCDAATTSADGCSELATSAETEAGTDTVRTTTPAGVLAAVAGLETIAIPAGGWTAETTTGCAAGSSELGNGIMQVTLDCDGATQEGMQHITPQMPKSWNEGTVTARISWTNASGTGDVIWLVSCAAVSDDDVMNASFGTEVSVTDSVTAAADLMITPVTGAITCGGTPAEGDLIVWRIQRDADAAGDTLNSVDAKFLGANIFYTTNAFTDD
jgi:hypothetical protein